jgi:hypothetical protein
MNDEAQITIFVFFAAFCRTEASEFLTAHDREEERDYESQTADNQIQPSRQPPLHTRQRLVCGQWSVVFPTLFPSLPSVKNPFARRGRRVYGYGKPQVRHGESVSPRRPDEERSRHFTMARKDAAPLARRRVD